MTLIATILVWTALIINLWLMYRLIRTRKTLYLQIAKLQAASRELERVRSVIDPDWQARQQEINDLMKRI
jgi:hypothetical protein